MTFSDNSAYYFMVCDTLKEFMRLHIFRSGSLVVLVVVGSLGVMSLIRKMLQRHSNRTKISEKNKCESNDSVNTDYKDELQEQQMSDDVTSAESCSDDELTEKKQNEAYRRKRRKLNGVLRRHSKKESKVDRMQRQIIQVEAEISEVRRMLNAMNVREMALKEETQVKKQELFSQFPVIQEDMEKEIKRKEPILYKRYTSIRSATEASSLLTTIRNKRSALDKLEVLTHNKYISIKHDKSSNSNRHPLSPSNTFRPNFEQLFQSIRGKLALQQQCPPQHQQPFGEFVPVVNDMTPTSSGTGTTTLRLRPDPDEVPVREAVV